MKIKKTIIQEKLPKPWWKSVLSYVIWYSHTFFPCFGIFEKRLSALWKLCKCAVGIVSGRRALCRAGALGHSQDYSAAMGAFPSLLPRFAKGRGVRSRESWEGTDPVKGEAPSQQPGIHPGLKGDAVGRVYTCCCCFLMEMYWKCHPWLPGQTHFSFLWAARGVINCYCRESTQCFSFNSKDVFNLPVALCKL